MLDDMFKFRFYTPDQKEIEKRAAHEKSGRTDWYGPIYRTQDIALLDLISGNLPEGHEKIAQYLGFKDFLKNEIYEADVLELCVTQRLMETSFAGSNLGRILKKEPYVRSVVMLMCHSGRARTCAYEVYFMDDDMAVRRDRDGDPRCICSGEDAMFPMYLAEKGARVVTDIFNDTSALHRFSCHTLWNSIPELQSEYARRHGKDGYHGMPSDDDDTK